MLEIDEEKDVAEIRGRQALSGKEKAHATSTFIKISSIRSNMCSDSVGGLLSKRRDLMDAFFTFDPVLEVEKMIGEGS